MRSFFSWLTAVAVLLFLAFGGTAAQAQVTGSAATASAKKPKPKPAVKILDASQKALTGPGVKLRVTANTRMKVRVTVSSTTFDDGTRNLTKPRVISFGKKGRKVVRIPLVKTGKTAAASCAARQVTVIGQTGKRRSRATRDMARQLKDCRLAPVELSRAADCDWIAQPNEGLCMLPFPNDYYTVKDSSTETGKRINFTLNGMPRNNRSVPINPASYLASDGFSQGQSIVLKVPGIDTPADIERNGFVQLKDLGRYAEPDQRALVIDVKTGQRWPIWVDVDQTGTDPAKAALMISPAKNFDEKGRYIVALRKLLGPDGKVIPAPNAFRYLRDGIPSGQNRVNQRRSQYEGIFKTLRKAGIKRSDLYLAWDFTAASNENNYERALYMRNDAFAELGDNTMADQVVQGDSPDFVVTTPQPLTHPRPEIEREIRGTFTVPCYLTNGCEPGGVMTLNAEGFPERQGEYEAKFTCIVPPVGLTGPNADRLRPYIFGHGLVGTGRQVTGSINPNLVQEHKMIACATDEIGMASEDVPTIFQSLTELSSFDVVPDRLQQGLLNELFLARLMYHPDGLGTHPAFQDGDGVTPGGESVIRQDHVYYMGASQGGIMGGPLTAISPDFTQAALVVGAMNYSTLLTRSSNWKTYALAFDISYQNELSRPLVLGLIQMLWDRGEPNGYSHVMTDNPPPETPEHRITMHVALGDHQVSNFASDVQARTVPGVKTPAGGIDPRRWPDYEELWNIPRIQADEYPYYGSSIVYWDGGPFRKNPNYPPGRENIGTGVSPYGNVPPSSVWEDPHGAPRGASGPVEMINTFFDPNGYIEDVCGGAPCLGDGWDGDYDSVIVP